MLYKNKRTGAVISSPCDIFGGNWTPFDGEDKEAEKDLKAEEREEESEKRDQTDMTRADIIQELEAFGIEYDPKMKKDELYKLMVSGG